MNNNRLVLFWLTSSLSDTKNILANFLTLNIQTKPNEVAHRRVWAHSVLGSDHSSAAPLLCLPSWLQEPSPLCSSSTGQKQNTQRAQKHAAKPPCPQPASDSRASAITSLCFHFPGVPRWKKSQNSMQNSAKLLLFFFLHIYECINQLRALQMDFRFAGNMI